MTAAHDYDDLHHLVDRLSPAQARRLRTIGIFEAEPDLGVRTRDILRRELIRPCHRASFELLP